MWKLLVRWWKKFNGWHDCPCCGQLAVCFVKDVIYHPEEPPCFGHWECHACMRRTPTEPTMLMEEAARSKGYASFADFAEKNLKP